MKVTSARKLNVRSLVFLTLCLLPLLFFYAFLIREMRGLPMFDDYQALVAYATQFQRIHGALPKLLYAVGAQHDEYKLIFEHFVIGLQLLVSKHIHYRFLTMLGNIFVVGILALYWREHFPNRSLEQRLLSFAPISFLLMQLNYVESLDWAMCGLQMIPVIFFSLLALHLLPRRSPTGFVLACVAAWLGCLASANGFLLAPVGFILILQRRNFRRAAVWTCPFFLALAMYLFRYVPITRAFTVQHPTFLQKTIFFFSFLGGAVENMHHFPLRGLSTVLGMGLFVVFAYALYLRYDRQHPFAFYTAAWIMTSAAVVTQVRIGLGLNMSLNPRYKIYSDLMLIFAYGFAMERVSRWVLRPSARRTLYGFALAFSILLSVSSDWFGYRFLVRRRERVETGFRLYLADPSHVSPEISTTGDPILGGEPEFCRRTMNDAIAEGSFIPPLLR